ncbi:MAG: putative ABC transport system permease protein, partial [Ancylomarina sp.]
MQRIKHIFRSIFKYRTASTFTVLSLVTAFLCIIIISLYVSFERSYDDFHTNGESIYRIETVETAMIPAVLADVVREKVPEIVNVSATCYRGQRKISIDNTGVDNEFIIASPLYVEGEFLSMFTFPLIKGNAATSLVEAGNIVLSESLSKKIFGNENAYGKTLFLNKRQLTVSGVMKDFPTNSTFKSDCLVSFETLTKDNGGEKSFTKAWSEWSFYIFIQTFEGANPDVIIDKISEIEVLS